MRNMLALSIVAISVGSYGCGARAQSAEQIMADSGIHGLVQWIQDEPTRKAPELYSGEAVARMVNKDQKGLDERFYEFGATLSEEIENMGIAKGITSDSLRQIDDLIMLRQWIASGYGYGNLVLCYQCEDAALSCMLSYLKMADATTEEMHARLMQIRQSDIGSDYWSSVVIEKSIASSAVSHAATNDSEIVKMRNLLQPFLQNGENKLPPRVMSYHECYMSHNISQIAWKVVFADEKRIALECCLRLKDVIGRVPGNRDEFILALREHASDILRNKDSLAGPVTPHNVWRIWANENERNRQGLKPAQKPKDYQD